MLAVLFRSREVVEQAQALRLLSDEHFGGRHRGRSVALRTGRARPCIARHPGYAVSEWIRKRVEEVFDRMGTGVLRRTRYRGCERVQMHMLHRRRRLQPHQNCATRTGSRLNLFRRIAFPSRGSPATADSTRRLESEERTSTRSMPKRSLVDPAGEAVARAL
jgi:hypothetical protein